MNEWQELRSSLETPKRSVNRGARTRRSPTLMAQVAADLAVYLTAGKESDRHSSSTQTSRRLNFMARKTGLHAKTLQRLLQQQTSPTAVTLLKIYRHLTGISDDRELLARVPEVVREFLKAQHPSLMVESPRSLREDLAEKLISNPIALEIYLWCGTGPVKRSSLRARFGAYGLQVVDELIRDRILMAISAHEVAWGEIEISPTLELLHRAGLRLAEQHARPQLGYETSHNHLGFFIEALTPEAYQAWLKIDAEAFRQKVELAQKPENRGQIRAFTYSVIDQISESL